MLLSLWNVLNRATTAGMYGSSSLGLSVTIDIYCLRFLRTLSFAPDFGLHLRLSFGHPRMGLVNKQELSVSKPEVADMDCVPSGGTWQLAKRVMWATKRYMFLAQTQIYLAEFKMTSDIFGEHLDIDIPFCTDCHLKCDNQG
jgi:hypothetical protein